MELGVPTKSLVLIEAEGRDAAHALSVMRALFRHGPYGPIPLPPRPAEQ